VKLDFKEVNDNSSGSYTRTYYDRIERSWADLGSSGSCPWGQMSEVWTDNRLKIDLDVAVLRLSSTLKIDLWTKERRRRRRRRSS